MGTSSKHCVKYTTNRGLNQYHSLGVEVESRVTTWPGLVLLGCEKPRVLDINTLYQVIELVNQFVAALKGLQRGYKHTLPLATLFIATFYPFRPSEVLILINYSALTHKRSVTVGFVCLTQLKGNI